MAQNDSPSITVPVEDVTDKMYWQRHIGDAEVGNWLVNVSWTGSGLHITLNNMVTKVRKQFIVPYQGIVEGLVALESEKSE